MISGALCLFATHARAVEWVETDRGSSRAACRHLSRGFRPPFTMLVIERAFVVHEKRLSA